MVESSKSRAERGLREEVEASWVVLPLGLGQGAFVFIISQVGQKCTLYFYYFCQGRVATKYN